MSPRLVSVNGVHYDEHGIAWLVQGTASTNAVGLKGPPEIQLGGAHHASRVYRCNTQIDLDQQVSRVDWQRFRDTVLPDPLFQIMAPHPAPRQFVGWVRSEDLPVVCDLIRMTRPITSAIQPAWAVAGRRELLDLLRSSNIQPLVLMGVARDTVRDLRDLFVIAQSLPRQLILVPEAPMRVPGDVRLVSTGLEPNPSAPWEGLGATYIRNWMRGEL